MESYILGGISRDFHCYHISRAVDVAHYPQHCSCKACKAPG